MVLETKEKKDFEMIVKRLPLSVIKFNQSVYPRKDGHDASVVQRYAQDIEAIEAAGAYITVAEDCDLLDGRHRWLAYLTAYEGQPEKEIPVRVARVTTDAEKYLLAVRLNSTHGFALSAEDRQHSAISLYNLGWTVETIALELSVRKQTASGWLSRTVKEQRDGQNRRLKALWLASYTNTEIADLLGMTEQNVRAKTRVIAETFQGNEIANTPDSDPDEGEDGGALGGSLKPSKADIANALHQNDFEVPIYNIWKQQAKSNRTTHFGNSEQRWLDNLLYLYTNPLDIVIDPFGGGGSTIDVCKRRWRRYWCGDRRPVVSRNAENELGGIRLHDIVGGDGKPNLPDLRGRWGEVKLVYLDPPYWKQAAGQYGDEPSNLANMELDDFNKILSSLITDVGKRLKDAYIALIIQPTQWNAPNREFTDHIGDMLRMVKFPVEMRYSVPYESQQYNAQMVDWAKDNRSTLVLTREIVVWRIKGVL